MTTKCMAGPAGHPETPALSDASQVNVEIADYDYSVRPPAPLPPGDEQRSALIREASRRRYASVPASIGTHEADQSLTLQAVSIRRTLSYVAGEMIFAPPKTERSRRIIELSDATVSALPQYRFEQSTRRLMLGPAWQEHGLLFPSTIGAPWLSRVLYRGYRKVLERSGISDPRSVNWHTLRHTAATQWLGHGVEVFSVSRRLGHASASFTMDVYAHLLRGQQRQAAEALDYLLA